MNNPLHQFDAAALERGTHSGAQIIIGIDEAGRGPLAGPVSACACYIPPELAPHFKDVNDSKKLSESKREKLFELALSLNVPHNVKLASSKVIDNTNILAAALAAMKDAADELAAKLRQTPLLLIDGNQPLRNCAHAQRCVVGGDGKSLSIALASVMAKVTRDRYMRELDKKYPQYGFAGHKGYGSKTHMEAIAKYGPTEEHRMSFAPLRQGALFK